MSFEVQQALKSWPGDQRVMKYVGSFCSKNSSLQEFLSERQERSLKEKFAKQKRQKFSCNQLEEALDYLRKYQKQHQQLTARRSHVESGYDSVSSLGDRQPGFSKFSNTSASVADRPLPPVPTESSSEMSSVTPTCANQDVLQSIENPYDILDEKPEVKPAKPATDDPTNLDSFGGLSDETCDCSQAASVAYSDGPERGQYSESYSSNERSKICVGEPCNGNALVGVQVPTPRPRHSLANTAACVKPSAASGEARGEHRAAQSRRAAIVDAKERSSREQCSQNGCLNIRGTKNLVDCDLSALLMLQSAGPKWG